MLELKPGNLVKILTPELADDPNEYQIDNVVRSVAFLTCKSTGCQVKVHKTRIKQVLNQTGETRENNMTTSTTEDQTVTTVIENGTPPTKREKSAKQSVPVNFEESPFTGLEVWQKKGCGFNVSAMEVVANCVFLPSSAGFVNFNTYNGSLGRGVSLPEDNRLPGSFHQFGSVTPEKKREQLAKKGYTLRQV